MNIEKKIQQDGIIVTEKIDYSTVQKIAQNISKKLVNTFPDFDLNENEICEKLSNLSMYKADMPEGMAEANYCYKNSSIYFNSHIDNEDLEEFAIHECIHFLQEIKDENGKIKKMGLSNYNTFTTVGTGINEASVQYISAKIIGIKPDFEKYYNINVYTPSPSYYPIECALLNELIFFIGEDVVFKSTLFSTEDLKNAIINLSSQKTYNLIIEAFDNILKFEEKIIKLNNNMLKKKNASKIGDEIIELKHKINTTFVNTQHLIIKNFLDSSFNKIENLEELENYRRNLENFKKIIGIVDNDIFFDNYYIESMNKLEHKANILENNNNETAIEPASFSFISLFKKIKNLLLHKEKVVK